jgi:predicted metal-dependent enzyme (double-stranded beta helix superfamily)
MSIYGLADLVQDIRRAAAAARSPTEILRRLIDPARRLALDPSWIEPRFRNCDPRSGFGVTSLHEEDDGSLSVVVAALLPGRSLPPHNHKTWALQAGIEAEEINVAWRRLDDGKRPGYAELAETGRRRFGPGEVLTFQPEDIHSILNESDRVALSLNLYGISYARAHSEKFDPVAHTAKPLLAP